MAASRFLTLDDLSSATRVIARVDLNSPVEAGRVEDNRRFDRHAETVRELADAGHRVILLAHQGRPGGDDFISLKQHAAILSEHVGHPVAFCRSTVGDVATTAIDAIEPGEILLLENVRMEPDELATAEPAAHAESALVRSLATCADVYVGDAYSVAHRSHASIVGLPLAMDEAYAGRVMEAEYAANTAIRSRTFDGPVTMALGGVKVGDLIRVVRAVDETVDRFLLGGVIGQLCLRADGADVGSDVEGTDLYDDLWAAHGDALQALMDDDGERLVLPVDLAYADEDGERAEVSVAEATGAHDYRDVGTDTVEHFEPHIERASAVFVKGALGVFEDERFRHGTVGLLRSIAESDAFSVVGGGDTSRAIDLYGLDSGAFDHVSIAGGAYVRALTGESLPGVEVLSRD